jgi:hypothetical protein
MGGIDNNQINSLLDAEIRFALPQISGKPYIMLSLTQSLLREACGSQYLAFGLYFIKIF